MALKKITDHAEQAIARLPQQFQGKKSIEFLIRALCRPWQDLEGAAYAVLIGRLIDTAIGDQLTGIGAIVGQPRGGVTDDDLYRRYVRARVAVTVSKGTYADILAVTRLVLGDADIDIIISDGGVASVLVTLGPYGVDPAVAAILIEYLRETVAAGVRIQLTHSAAPDDHTWSPGSVTTTDGVAYTGAPLKVHSTYGFHPSGSILIDPGGTWPVVRTYTGLTPTSFVGLALPRVYWFGTTILQYDENTGMGDTSNPLIGGDFASVLE